MKFILRVLFFTALIFGSSLYGQETDPVIENIILEARTNSQLEDLAHELIDVIGPRLTGTPQIHQAHDWVVQQYEDWGISARKEHWGEWRGWERGITHIDMIHPRVQTLRGTQLAYSPDTGSKSVKAEVIVFPDFEDYYDFVDWLPQVAGKFVMISFNQPTGRPDDNWLKHATQESYEQMVSERDSLVMEWKENMANTGYSNHRSTPWLNDAGIAKLEDAGAAGIISCRWSGGFGANRIFDSDTRFIPTLGLELEDYGLLYRLAESGQAPEIEVVARSRNLGTVRTFNSIGEIKGTMQPEEYVILSAHLDSWDGATGATDNGTGTILMMEVMRILKQLNPNPKRTILAGHWAFEEGGLNGSRAFVEDHPEIVGQIQVVFNQDNGTGRITELGGSGFKYSGDYLGRWLEAVPEAIRSRIETNFPGMPNAPGSSDHRPFVAVDVPAFRLRSHEWGYRNYTWHTNRDTYDKIVFEDMRDNVILTAILTYMASEDPERASNERRDMPVDPETGLQTPWLQQKLAKRKYGQ